MTLGHSVRVVEIRAIEPFFVSKCSKDVNHTQALCKVFEVNPTAPRV